MIAPPSAPPLLADLRECLRSAPTDTREDRFEAWVWQAILTEHGQRALAKQSGPSHFTASGIVLSPSGTRTCLVLHGKLGLWVQPGGHLEPQDTSVAGAAAREVWEETGLTGEILPGPVRLARHPAPCGVPGADWHLDVQHLLVAKETEPVVSVESLDVRWFPVRDLPADVAPGVPEAVLRASARLTG